jgi:trehalose 6-phosphate phosphatase
MSVHDSIGDNNSAAVDMRQAPSRARLMLAPIADIKKRCIFLDFDGTLVEIKDCPEGVRVDASTRQFVEHLRDRVGRELARESGRKIRIVDRLLHPLTLPIAGVHGLQRRDAAGRLHAPCIDCRGVDTTATQMEAGFITEPGIVVDRKMGAVAIRFRLRPNFEKRCCAFARRIVQHRPDRHLVRGKIVCEIGLNGNDNGAVIAAVLDERPFKERTPIFAGDDGQDEAGVAAVNACGGVSIKIGQEPSIAKYRAANIGELRDWFEVLLAPARIVSIQ